MEQMMQFLSPQRSAPKVLGTLSMDYFRSQQPWSRGSVCPWVCGTVFRGFPLLCQTQQAAEMDFQVFLWNCSACLGLNLWPQHLIR